MAVKGCRGCAHYLTDASTASPCLALVSEEGAEPGALGYIVCPCRVCSRGSCALILPAPFSTSLAAQDKPS